MDAANATDANATDALCRSAESAARAAVEDTVVGRRRLAVSKPVLKAPMVSALETIIC